MTLYLLGPLGLGACLGIALLWAVRSYRRRQIEETPTLELMKILYPPQGVTQPTWKVRRG